MDFPGFPAQLRSWVGEAQLLQLRRLELRRLEGTHGAEQRCAMLQARCRSLEQDLELPSLVSPNLWMIEQYSNI